MDLHAIEPTRPRANVASMAKLHEGQHRVDGVGRPKFDFHEYKRHHHHNKVSQWRLRADPGHVPTFFYYGVMQIAIVENPFNFADVDHGLDSFSKRLHDKAVAESPRGTAPRLRITERKFAARDEKRKKKKRTGEGYFKQVIREAVA